MMRRTLSILALLAAAVPASAQMPPSIKGPIDAAKRQANKTSAQINEEQKIGDQAGKTAAPKQAPAATGAATAKAPAKTAAKPAAKAPAKSEAQTGSVTQNGTKASWCRGSKRRSTC